MPKVTIIRDRVQPSTRMGELAMAGDVVEVPKKEADLYIERGWAKAVAAPKPPQGDEAGQS